GQYESNREKSRRLPRNAIRPIDMSALVATIASCLKSYSAFDRWPGNWSVDMSFVPEGLRSSRARKLDPQLFHVGEISAPASGREDAIVERDVSVDCSRENYSGHNQVGAHEAHSRIVSAQAVRKLLRQHDQGCAVAPPRNTQPRGDARKRPIGCWNEPIGDLARQGPLAGEIEVRRAENRDHFRGRASGRYFGRTVITDIDIRNFVHHPQPWQIAKPAARKACRPKMLHTWDMERLIAAELAHPDTPKRQNKYRKAATATNEPRTK